MKTRKVFQCQKEGNFKTGFLERKFKKKNESNEEMARASIVTDGYLCAEVLMATSNFTQEEWVLNTGCSYHMTPNKYWFLGLKEVDVDSVIMGINTTCI